MRFLLAALVIAFLPFPAFADSLTIPNEFTNSTTADADEVNANFTAVKSSVDELLGVRYYADPNEEGTTSAGVDEALARCGAGIDSADPSLGCVIQMACGEFDIEGITLAGDTTETAKEGVTLLGCGGGATNTNEDAVGGTVLRAADSFTGTMIEIGNCAHCTIADIGIDGEDSATVGIDFVAGEERTSLVKISNVAISEINGWGVRTDTTGQTDLILLERVSIRDSVGCFQQRQQQSFHFEMSTSECSNISGTKMFDLQQGEFSAVNSYFGVKTAGQTAIEADNLMHYSIRENRFELNAANTKGIVTPAVSGAGAGGIRDANLILNNVFIVQSTGVTCIDADRRGHLTVSNNSFVGLTSGIDAGCTLSAQSSEATASTKEFYVHSYGNSHRTLWEAEDFGGSIDYSIIPWTIGTDTTLFQDHDGTHTTSASDLTSGTLATARMHSDATLDSELAAKSAATSTDNAIARFDSTAGDVQNSGVTIDDSNNVTIPGDLETGTSGATCLILRDSDDGGNSACQVLNGTFTCEADTNDTCGDAT